MPTQMTIFQVASQFALCIAATILYARRLSRRNGFHIRAIVAGAVAIAACAAAIATGYTLYPTLTDDPSFFMAIVMFAVVVAALTGFVLFLWDASPWTAFFCASSGYLIQSIVLGLDRILHMTGLVHSEFSETGIPLVDALSMLVCAAVVLALFYWFIARRLERSVLLGVRNPIMAAAITIAMAVTLVFDLAIKDIIVFELPWRYSIVLVVIYLVVCIFILIAEYEILYNQRLQADVATMERAMAEQEHQFELSRETVDAINRRVHDIRHHVAKLLAGNDAPADVSKETLHEVVRKISIYDAAVKTGNASLDVVLTEKGLLCGRDGITLSSVADGTALAFMTAADIYTLVGTALDNAIDAVREIEDASKRSVSLNLRSQMGMASLSVENYFSGEVELSNGLPAREGLGMEKILSIVERYDGTIVCSVDGDVFHLDALIPQG